MKIIQKILWYFSPCRKCKVKDLEHLVECSCTKGFLFEKKWKRRNKMKKLFLILLVSMVCFTGCMNVTRDTKKGTTPFPTFPTHIEFWNGGTCIGEYDDAIVTVKTAYNTFWVGEPVTWYIYEVQQGGVVVDTIIDSEALSIKFRGQK